MIGIVDQSRILSGILGTPFFIFSSFLILVGYVVLWFRKRQTLTNAISIFEVPLIMSCLSVIFSLMHLGIRALCLSWGIDSAMGTPLYILTGIFYVSTAMLTVANNLLLPLLFTYCISFFIKNTNFRLTMFVVAILYTNTKYLIFIRVLPNFIQFNFTSFMDPTKCLIMNPIDLSMLIITHILIFCRLQFIPDKLSFETAVVIFEVLWIAVLKMIGMVSDTIAIKMFSSYLGMPVFIAGLNTETVLMKNYEFTQMIIPYLFIVCGLIIKLEKFRKRASVAMAQAVETGNVKWINGGKKTTVEAQSTVVAQKTNTVAGPEAQSTVIAEKEDTVAGPEAHGTVDEPGVAQNAPIASKPRLSLTVASIDTGERRPPIKVLPKV